MKRLIVGTLLLLVAQGFFGPAHAVTFFDVSKPGIKKLAIFISADKASPQNDKFVKNLRALLNGSLLFDSAAAKSKAAFSLILERSVESKEIRLRLTEEGKGTGFEPILFGVRFRNTEADYLRLKVAQIGNTIIRKFFGVKGSLGSTLVWAATEEDESVKTLKIGDFGYKNEKQLTYNLFSNVGASWNPDQDTIIFTSHTARGTRLMVQRTNPLRARQISVFESGGRGGSSFWSSDGSVFVSLFVGEKNTDIFQFSLDGDPYKAKNAQLKKIRKVTESAGIDTEPAISPDGKRMAFTSDRSGAPQIYVMDLAKGKAKRTTRKGNYNASPAWSPDGKYIAYFGIRGGEVAVFRMRLEDGDEQRLTSKRVKAEAPTWSPDGSMIAFKGEVGKKKSKIYYMLSTGGKFHRLTNARDSVAESNPAWGPVLR